MNYLEEHSIACPYCAQMIQVLIDPEDRGQEYIEDCQVCCQPIYFTIRVQGYGAQEMSAQGNGLQEKEALVVDVRAEND